MASAEILNIFEMLSLRILKHETTATTLSGSSHSCVMVNTFLCFRHTMHGMEQYILEIPSVRSPTFGVLNLFFAYESYPVSREAETETCFICLC